MEQIVGNSGIRLTGSAVEYTEDGGSNWKNITEGLIK